MALKMKLNKEELKNKIYGCWIGKNIGGTVGGPYEGREEMLDIEGFSTKKGEPLPNDDLDLQMAWLATLERVGAEALDANALADSWLMLITPHWNEYGIAKKNLELGLLPPLSGEFQNKLWRNSNGAWIRTEVWACLAPGFPNIAIKYAIMDSSVDHGLGEGTVAAIFTAALESIAFAESDVRKAIETALSYIPSDSRVYDCVKCVLDEYDNGTPYRETREKIVKMTEDLGIFQAPNNIAFVTIGLIYGEGDFKKSIIYATNCGDDTDCTAGTVGSVLGIIYGANALPEDWKEYIGDRISQICINASYSATISTSCSELTERLMKRIPGILDANGVYAEFANEDTYCKDDAFNVLSGYAKEYYKRKPYSFDINLPNYLVVRVEFDGEPVVKSGEEIKFTIKFKQLRHNAPINGSVDISLPTGWSAKYSKYVHISRPRDLLEKSADYGCFDVYTDYEVSVLPGEDILPVNKIWVNVTMNTRALPLTIPISLIG